MNPVPQLPPASTDPTKPHPIDAALAALSQFTAELLASNKPSRFAEMQTVAAIAIHVQRLRPVAGVDDVVPYDEDGEDGLMVAPGIRRRHHARYNDGADLNTQILMMAQNFLGEYTKTLAKKEPKSDSRMGDVMELESLMGLRMQLTKDSEPVPEAITTRINCLLKRIGEPPHEPEPDSVLSSDDVRRYPPDGAVEPDRGRVGEPLAERAGGDDGAR